MKAIIPMLDTPHSGGTRALVELANGLVQRGHQCTIVLPRGTKPLPFPTISPIVQVGPRLPYVRNARNLMNAALLARFLPPADIVLATTWLSAFPTYWGTRNDRAIGFYFIQGDERTFFHSNLMGRLKSALANKSYHLDLHWLTNSIWLRDRLNGEFQRKAAVANPGVDTQVFCPDGRSSPTCKGGPSARTIACIGRSAPAKGLPDLLKALEWVSKEIEIRLLLISQEQLHVQAPYPIQVTRPRSDLEMADAYRKADVFVFPSWIEGYGLPPLEAMACGVPVVTSDCGGIQDFAEDGTNALIVPPRDPQALAEAILRLLRDRSLAEKLTSNGLATAKELTWDRYVENAEQAFLCVLDSR